MLNRDFFSIQGGDDDEDEDDEDDDEEEEDDDEDTNVMFDGTCRLFERIVGENGEETSLESGESSLGVVDLKILYDDDVYGARIVAVEHEQVFKIF